MRLQVLHVDDESDIREVVELALGFEPDFTTRSCSSGKEALHAVADFPPDIILLDVMMPVMDGPTTLACLRDNPGTANIPVLFMTARVQARELDAFYSLGAVGVIAKPFDPMTLAASVRAHVPPAPSFDIRLDALRAAFLRRTEKDAVALSERRSTMESGKAILTTWSEIKNVAHGLAGAAGIFGFHDISNAAASLEEAITPEDAVSNFDEISHALDCLLVCIELTKRRQVERRPFPVKAAPDVQIAHPQKTNRARRS
jgi:two-component system OmpR family response regulator